MFFLYSLLHFLVDGICALTLAGFFLGRPGETIYILIYNFCAFVLQMPLGLLLDALILRGTKMSRRLSWLFASVGCVLTFLGAAFARDSMVVALLLGIGNGLFHVGGGVATIREDEKKGWGGMALGVFVAPGAMGLFLGKTFGEQEAVTGDWGTVLICFSFLAILLLGIIVLHSRKENQGAGLPPCQPLRLFDREDYAVMAACAVVVILRSYVGFAVSYPWRTGIMAGVVATACIVLGKMLGGLCMCAFGKRKTILASLLLAALCYVFLAHPFTGLLSLLFFNMTMPITLCMLVSRFPAFGGFMFGLLTAALFVGYPLSYVPLPEAIKGWMLGVGGCIISCLILLALCRKEKKSFQKEVV